MRNHRRSSCVAANGGDRTLKGTFCAPHIVCARDSSIIAALAQTWCAVCPAQALESVEPGQHGIGERLWLQRT